MDKNINKAEINRVTFLAKHNLLFYITNHLLEIIRVNFSDSKIAEKYKNIKTKATAKINKNTAA